MGEYPILVEVSDGLAPVQKRGTITVASTGAEPIVIPIADLTLTENIQAGGQLATPDPDLKGSLTWSLIQGPTGFTVTPSGQWAWQPGERFGGTRWNLVAEATDGRLTSRVAFKIQVTEDNQSPVWLVSQAPVWTETQEAAWQLAASDTDDPVQMLSYRLVEGPTGLTVNTNGLVRWTPTEAQGPSTHRLRVAVGDGVASVTNLFEIRVLELNQSPVWTSDASLTLNEGEAFERQLGATDADLPAQTLTYTLLSGPTGLSVSRTGLLKWTPTEAQGPSTASVRITVSDGNESLTRDLTLVVREVNQPPTWGQETPRTIAEGSPYEFRLGASDSDLPAQTLVYRLLSGPTGLTVGTDGRVQWTPTEAQGPSTNDVDVAVSDGVASVTNRVRIQVQETNAAPAWAGETLLRITEGQTLSVTLPVKDTDLPAQALRFTLESGPDGLLVSTNGLMVWAPTEAQGPSTNQVRVRVSDGVATVPLEFVVAVDETNAAPVWSANPGTRRVNEGSLLSFSVQATDSDVPAQPLTYRLVEGPWGLTLTTNGLVSWRPTEVQGPSTNRVRLSAGDGVAATLLEFDIIVRDSITGSPGPSLGLSISPDGTITLGLSGIAGGRYRVEQLTTLGGTWTPVPGLPEVVTQGTNSPSTLRLPTNPAPGLFIRLRKL